MPRFDVDDFVQRYNAGESLSELAEEAGVDRQLVRYHLRKRGVPLRSVGDAVRLATSQLSEDERFAKSAHLRGLADGRELSDSFLADRAVTRHDRQTHITPKEEFVVGHLRAAEIPVLQQFPLGGYNLDIALEKLRIAVEIEGSGWGEGRKAKAYLERMEYILDQGWCVLFVICSEEAITAAVVDKIIAWFKIAGPDETGRGQYGVIRSDGKPTSIRRADLKHLTRVHGF